jgi:hypothetical protein
MWSDLVRDMPQGLPQAGDRGLDYTHSWGRTYWGGALFCLLADVEIRRRTNNGKGLQHALRGILDAGGDIRKDWNLEDALSAGDRAVGINVLQPLYARMKDKPMAVDLPTLWSQLGVQSDGSNVRFDDNATLAAIRRAITTAAPSPVEEHSSLPKATAVFAGSTVGSSHGWAAQSGCRCVDDHKGSVVTKGTPLSSAARLHFDRHDTELNL